MAAIDDGLSLAEQVVMGVRTTEQITEQMRRNLQTRRRRRRLGGFAFGVSNLLLEDGCNIILEDGNGVYLLEPC